MSSSHSTTKYKIGLDIDETVYPLCEAMLPKLNYFYNSKFKKEDFEQHDLSYLGLNLDEFLRSHPEVMFTHEPNPFDRKVLQGLAKQGHQFMYVTARKPEHLNDTLDWLYKHDMPTDAVVCCPNKASIAVRYGLDVVVDDYVMNLYYVAGEGIDTLLVDQPWNRKNPDFKRIYGMNGLQQYISDRNRRES